MDQQSELSELETTAITTTTDPSSFDSEFKANEESNMEVDSSCPVVNSSSMGPESFVSFMAKAFVLDSESNEWEELATGYCSPDPSEDETVFAIRIRSVEDSSIVIFTAYIHKNQEITMQNDTVLTWTTNDGEESALSFESCEGCTEFWRLICRFQGRSGKFSTKHHENEYEKENAHPSEFMDTDEYEDELDDGEDDLDDAIDVQVSSTFGPDGQHGSYDFLEDAPGSTIEISFPERPEINNLQEVQEAFHQALLLPILRKRIASVLIEYSYIPALLEIFRHCEDLGMEPELGRLFQIFKCIFLLNNQEILRELFYEGNYLDVAGVMEYYPVILHGEKGIKYRMYLADKSRFKQVIPLNNENLLQIIHQTFRLQYFKDVILASFLDEESSASLQLIIRLNHMTIINSLDNDPEVLQIIRALLQSDQMELTDQLQLLKFFKEFLVISRTVALKKSLQIYQAGVMSDFLHFLTRVLLIEEEEGKGALETDSADTKTETLIPKTIIFESKLLSIELFITFLQHDPSLVRNFLIQNSPQRGLLSTLIDIFLDPLTSSQIRWQILTALKLLLDTFTPAILQNSLFSSGASVTAAAPINPLILNQALTQKSNEEFLNYFYPDFAGKLLKPLIDFDKTISSLQQQSADHTTAAQTPFFLKSNLPESLAEILSHLSELLCSFIAQHKYRIKYLVLRNLIIQNCQLLFKCREKHLQLSGLRVFKATLATEDEFFYRFFIQHRSFTPIFNLYKASGGIKCDNLVTSAILELFESIRIPRESLKAIVRHLGTVYRQELETLGPESVFKGILETDERFDRESSVVSFVNSSSEDLTSPQQNQQRDEDYFSSVEEEEEEVVVVAGSDEVQVQVEEITNYKNIQIPTYSAEEIFTIMNDFPDQFLFKSPKKNADSDEDEDPFAKMVSSKTKK